MSGDPLTALRNLLHGRTAGHDRRLGDFTEPDWRRYADLLAGVFLLAVRRRFTAGQDRAPVIRFVAGVRERYDRSGQDIEPLTAEALIWAALGDTDPLPVTATTVTAQLLLLVGLLDDEGMPPAELDDLLDSAARTARTPTALPDPVPTGPAEAGPVPTGPAQADPVWTGPAQADAEATESPVVDAEPTGSPGSTTT